MPQWIKDIAVFVIPTIAIAALIFNSGVLYNDVKHLKKSVEDIWKKIDKIEQRLFNQSKK